MKPLVQKDVISKQQSDTYTAQRNNTAQLAESARQHLAELKAGTRTEDIHAARDRYQQALAADQLSHAGYRRQDITSGKGRLAQALAHVAELDASLREAHLLSPADATVETVSVRPGDLIPATYYIQIIRGIVLRGSDVSDLWLDASSSPSWAPAPSSWPPTPSSNKTPYDLGPLPCEHRPRSSNSSQYHHA